VDLVFKHANGTDQVTVKSWFADSTRYSQIERIEFADGTVWTNSEVNTRALEVFGSEAGEALSGVSAFVDTLHGAGGNDTLTAFGSGDRLDGGAGDDLLRVNHPYWDNTVTFIGGTGNDTMNASQFSDTYLFNVGDGQDTVNDYSAGTANTDVLRFGAGIAAADITPLRSGVDLVFKHANGTDQVTVKSWFADSTRYSQIERIEFADGTVWTNTTLNAQFNVVNGTAGADSLIGVADRYNVISSLDGNDSLTGSNSHDRLDGGNGDDALAGQGGNDTYVVNSAGDAITELLNEGVDFVESSITYALPENVEHLTLTGTAAIDGTGNDLDNALAGNSASNLLSGGAGNDNLNGAGGNDLLQGEGGNDTLADGSGTAYFAGGAGNDSITGGNGAELFIGGTGNDVITAGSGADLIVFNQGDGLDTVNGGIGTDNTLSLGNGIRYADLSLRKEANDLILDTGAGDSITFRDWYTASTNNKSVSTLQVILDATTDYDAGSADPTLNNKVEQFDFAGLAAEFDQALTATPTLTSWALTNALSDYHLAGSDSAALGGDLAYYYGTNGNLTGMSATAAQDVIGSASLGTANQTLREFSGISGGASTLR
jgi:Ca2+-binding RTX toxin-like protein